MSSKNIRTKELKSDRIVWIDCAKAVAIAAVVTVELSRKVQSENTQKDMRV